jgi:hypothetical protein
MLFTKPLKFVIFSTFTKALIVNQEGDLLCPGAYGALMNHGYIPYLK